MNDRFLFNAVEPPKVWKELKLKLGGYELCQ